MRPQKPPMKLFPHTTKRGTRSPHAPNLNRSALARKIGTTRAHMSMILSGKAQPSLEMLRRIARALKVGVNEADRFVRRIAKSTKVN
jgi:transcriptional regulator with XRE-family HTH domain